MLRRLPLIALFALTSCLNATPPAPAPEALDENLRWFWVNGEGFDDKTLQEGAAKLATGALGLSKLPLKGQMRNRLASADLAGIGLDKTTDPSTARGIMIVNTFACTLDKLQAVLIAQDQKSQYTGVYQVYDRTYTSDVDAFTSNKKNTLTWSVDLKAALPIDDVYTSTIHGGIRRLPATSTQGEFLITRTWLTAPATFSTSSTSYFKQDYQVEVFWEQTPGNIFHAYGMWREIKAGGFNLTLDDNGFMNLVLDNLVKWDETTVELCKK